MSGKGSRPRPLSVSQQQFSENWEKIFGKKSSLQEKPGKSNSVAQSVDKTK